MKSFRLEDIADCLDIILGSKWDPRPEHAVNLEELAAKFQDDDTLKPHQLRKYVLYLGNGILHTEERSQWFANTEAALLHRALEWGERTQWRIKR